MKVKTYLKRALSFMLSLTLAATMPSLPGGGGIKEAYADEVVKVTGPDLVTSAMTLLGSGYNLNVHYNASTNVYDCTGFVRRAMELAGYDGSTIPGYTGAWIDQIKNGTLAIKAKNPYTNQYESISVIYASTYEDYLVKVKANPTKFVALKTPVLSETLSEANLPVGSVVITQKTADSAAHAQIVIGNPIAHKTTNIQYPEAIDYINKTFNYFKDNYGLTQTQINKLKVYAGDTNLPVVQTHNAKGTWQFLPWSDTNYYKAGNFLNARNDFYIAITNYNGGNYTMGNDVWVIDDGADTSGVRLKMGISGKTAAAPAYVFSMPVSKDKPFELNIYKCSSANYIKVEGAEFTVYSDETCTKLQAGDNGSAKMTASGSKHTYNYTWYNIPDTPTTKYLYFKETKVPTGYSADKNDSGVQAIYRAELNSGDGTVKYSKRYGNSGAWAAISMANDGAGYVNNEPEKGGGTLKIVKTDDAGNPIKGVTFSLYSKGSRTTGELSDLITTLTTDENGIAAYTVDIGPYESMDFYVKETAAPAGYIISDEFIQINVMNTSATAVPSYSVNVLILLTKNSNGGYTQTGYKDTDRLSYDITGSDNDKVITVNYKVTNKATVSHSVVKTFGDADAKGSVKNVTAELYADGVATGKTVTLDSSNSWKYTWTGLDKYKDGKAIVYTAKETQINGKAITSYKEYVATSSTNGTTTNLVNYQPKTSYTLGTHKVLQGRPLQSGDAFTVTITPWKDTDGDKYVDELDTANATRFPYLSVSNDWKVTKTFDYTYADMENGFVASNGNITKYYKYEIKETLGTMKGVVYDTHIEQVIVKIVYDASEHTLTASLHDGNQESEFVNEYKATGSTDLKAFKNFDKELKGGEFEFVLTNTSWPSTTTAFLTRTVTNAKDGTVDFGTLNFNLSKTQNDCGTYVFTVEEKKGNASWVNYDSKKYTVTVVVSDNGDGTLKVTRSVNNLEYTPTSMTFINTSKATGSAVIEANKLFDLPYEAGAFNFDLELVSGPEGYTFTKETKSNDDKGHVVFNTLNFDQTMCGTYKFKVTEQKGKIPYVIYDDSIYYVTITVSDDTKSATDENAGKLTVKKTTEVVVGENAKAAEEIVFKNEYKSLEITKTDITTGKEIEGAELKIFAADKDGKATGEALYSWKSTKEAYVIKGINPGLYVLVETIAPEGYLRSESITFSVDADPDVKMTKVNMKDDYTKLNVTKENIEGNELIAGATMAIYKAGADGNKTGDALYRWVSDGTAYNITKIPVGNYVLVEEKAPEGYFLSPDVKFSVKETKNLQSVTMKDKDLSKLPTTGSRSGLIINSLAFMLIMLGSVLSVLKKRKYITQ